MANPPPYTNITGISRAAMKDNAQITLADYNGNARPGELVVDQTNDNLYVGNSNGSLTLIASGSGTETWATLGDKNNANGPDKIALGNSAGLTSQGNYAVAVGVVAGTNTQGASAVAVGYLAGTTSQGASAVAIGLNTGSTGQGTYSVAIGAGAGYNGQGNNSIAIGLDTGLTSQGTNSVAIGKQAGETSQANNSIILNATGSALNQTTANTFTVKPVRAETGVTFAAPTAGSVPAGFSPMYYNPTTGEIIVITT